MIFMEHDFLKKENNLLMKELLLHVQRYDTIIKIDSIKVNYNSALEKKLEKEKTKSKRRLMWNILLSVAAGALAVLSLK